MSSKRGGFQHNNVYRIVSKVDKHVIEVSASGTLVMMKNTKGAATPATQKFKSTQICEGDFRVSPVESAASGGQQAWDFVPTSPVLILSVSSDGANANQSWVAEEIRPNTNICLIKAKNDGRCLKSTGSGKSITLVPEDRSDLLTHWELKSTI